MQNGGPSPGSLITCHSLHCMTSVREICPNPENLILRLAGIRALPSFSVPASSGICSLYNPHLCTLDVVAWSGGQIIGLLSSLPGRRFLESTWNSYSYKQSIPSTFRPINNIHSSTPKYSPSFAKIFLPPVKMICFSENCLWEGYSPHPWNSCQLRSCGTHSPNHAL